MMMQTAKRDKIQCRSIGTTGQDTPYRRVSRPVPISGQRDILHFVPMSRLAISLKAKVFGLFETFGHTFDYVQMSRCPDIGTQKRYFGESPTGQREKRAILARSLKVFADAKALNHRWIKLIARGAT